MNRRGRPCVAALISGMGNYIEKGDHKDCPYKANGKMIVGVGANLVFALIYECGKRAITRIAPTK